MRVAQLLAVAGLLWNFASTCFHGHAWLGNILLINAGGFSCSPMISDQLSQGPGNDSASFEKRRKSRLAWLWSVSCCMLPLLQNHSPDFRFFPSFPGSPTALQLYCTMVSLFASNTFSSHFVFLDFPGSQSLQQLCCIMVSLFASKLQCHVECAYLQLSLPLCSSLIA